MIANEEIKYYQNRSHLLQLYVHRERAGDLNFNYEKWELPEGAGIIATKEGEEIVELPSHLAPQVFRTHGRLAWTKLEHKHVNPTGAEKRAPRLYQFAIKRTFNSGAHPDYQTSVLALTTGWSSGAR